MAMSSIVIDRDTTQTPSYWSKPSWLRVLAMLRFGRLRRAIRSRRLQMRIREQQRILHELPDHLLKDIGIGRDEIDTVARALIVNPDVDPRDRFRHGRR
jgi:uncharacterized protein YjiS (DUF1127 family)